MKKKIHITEQEKLTGRQALQKGLDAGYITLDNGTYHGKASDGVTVHLGMALVEDNVIRYLASHPEPKDW